MLIVRLQYAFNALILYENVFSTRTLTCYIKIIIFLKLIGVKINLS